MDSDLDVPSELEQIDVTVTGPDMRMESSMALLGDGQPALPRFLGVVHGGGELGPFEVVAVGSAGGSPVVTRTARFSFVRKQTLVLTMHLVGSCRGTSCASGQTCTEEGCRSVERSALPVWPGRPPRLGEVLDAGVDAGGDACLPEEICGNSMDDDCDGMTDEETAVAEVCNSEDDDCDGMVDEGTGGAEVCNGGDDDCDGRTDEGFDLNTDPMNCGMCNRQCVFRNGEGICNAGTCTVTSCNAGFDDCDSSGDNGCETDLTASASNCGACGNMCRNPDRVCCMSSCARSCP